MGAVASYSIPDEMAHIVQVIDDDDDDDRRMIEGLMIMVVDVMIMIEMISQL